MTFYSVAPVRFSSVSQVTATLGANDPEVGAIISEGDEDYVLVYNVGSSTIGVGQCATVSAVTGYSVTVSTTTNLDHVVGVCKHAAIATGSYGYLLTRGFGPAKMHADSGAVAGQLLTVGANGVLSVKSISTDSVGNVLGKAMSTTISAGTCDAFFTIF